MKKQELNQEWDRLNVRYERLMEKDNLSRREQRDLNSIYTRMRDIVSQLQA